MFLTIMLYTLITFSTKSSHMSKDERPNLRSDLGRRQAEDRRSALDADRPILATLPGVVSCVLALPGNRTLRQVKLTPTSRFNSV